MAQSLVGLRGDRMKVGDTVRVVRGIYDGFEDRFLGMEGTIDLIAQKGQDHYLESGVNVQVQGLYFHEDELELIRKIGPVGRVRRK